MQRRFPAAGASGGGSLLDRGGPVSYTHLLTQIAAVESALQSFGYIILQDHMETCVVEEIKNGNLQIVDEAVDLIKKLK